jgi:hypothetical protein
MNRNRTGLEEWKRHSEPECATTVLYEAPRNGGVVDLLEEEATVENFSPEADANDMDGLSLMEGWTS